jgi:adhesin transport system outer membrane protein
LYTWGRLDSGLRKAQMQRLVAEAARDESAQQLALRVVQNYGDWLAAYRKRNAYVNGLQLHMRLEQQVTRRVKEGQAAESDLALASSRLAVMAADLAATQAQEQVSLARLSQLVGESRTSKQLASVIAGPVPQRLPLSALIARSVGISPSLARFRYLAQVQVISVQEAKATYMPEVFVRLESQHGNFATAGLALQNRAFIGINSRFGAGLSNASAISEATSRQAASEAELQAQTLVLQEQVMTDYAVYEQSESRQKSLSTAAEMASKTLESWNRQYLSGRKSWQDYMNSARELVQIQAQQADLESAQLIASWRLAWLSGVLK